MSGTAAGYWKSDEWVYFAITYDNTVAADNVKFYIGTKTDRVVCVATKTLANAMPSTENKFTIGGQYNGSTPFGGHFDNIRLFGSKTDASGVLTEEQLEAIRINDINALPDLDLSQVQIGATNALADGDENINISVTVKDRAGYPMPNKEVILTKKSGDLDLADQSVETNSEGIANFSISSLASGTLTLDVKVTVGSGLEPVILGDEITINFVQAVDLTKSSFILSEEPVSADGVSEYKLKVQLKDYSDNAIDGREITLAPAHFAVVESTKITGQGGENPGEATFAIIAVPSEPLFGEVVATIVPDLAGGEAITLSTTIEFSGQLSIVNQTVTRFLALGLPVGAVAEDEIPNDGVSNWELALQLVDTNDISVAGRLVSISDEAAQLLDEDFLNTQARTDANGNVKFIISTARDLVSSLSPQLKVQVLNDTASWDVPAIKITPLVALWVTAVSPEPDFAEAEVDAPLIIQFSDEISLVANETKITLSPEFGEDLTYIYLDPSEANWEVSGKTLTFQHEKLKMNEWYDATIEGVRDAGGNPLFAYTWRFKGTDTTPPEIVLVDGRLVAEPLPWAVDVPLATELKMLFTEELLAPAGLPIGLNVELKPTVQIEFSSYDQDTLEVIYNLSSLSENTTYEITVSGAEDLAEQIMKPVSWRFTTTSAANIVEVISFTYHKNSSGDALVTTPIELYFNRTLKAVPAPAIVVKNEDNIPVAGETTFIDPLLKTGLVFQPQAEFAHDTTYRITLENVADEAGNVVSGWEESILTEVHSSGKQILLPGANTFVIPQQTGTAKVQVMIPEGAFQENVSLEVLNMHQADKDNLATKLYSQQLSMTPVIFELSTTANGFPVQPNQPVEISFPYVTNSEGKVTDLQGDYLLPANSLRLYKYEPLLGEWLPVKSTNNLSEQTVAGFVNSFGIYGLAGGGALPTSYLSEVKLSANPLAPGSTGARGTTTFKFALSHDSFITLTLYERSGRQVAQLLQNEVFFAGYNGFSWDGFIEGRKLPAGIYFYRFYATTIDPEYEATNWVSGAIGIIE